MITSSTFIFPTATLSFVSENPLLKNIPVIAAADIKRSCTACFVDGSWRRAHRLLTAEPTRSATSAALPFASFATSPTDCPASLSFDPELTS